jgi:hypothetical protein
MGIAPPELAFMLTLQARTTATSPGSRPGRWQRPERSSSDFPFAWPIAIRFCGTGDLSEDDLATGGRLSLALTDLEPDMIRHYAARLEEPPPRALSIDRRSTAARQ